MLRIKAQQRMSSRNKSW